MGRKPANSCGACLRLRAKLAAQQARINTLQTTLRQLQQQLAQVQEQLARSRKNSANSSKPPSSDLVKPPKPPPPEGQSKRQQGGQPGHPHHQRPPVPPELLNGGTHLHTVEICPTCGLGLQPTTVPPKVVQQIEIAHVPVSIAEHRALAGWCAQCQKHHYASLPSEVAIGGLVGPRLTTLIAYLKGACHASFSTIRKFLRDVVRVTLARSLLAKVIAKVSRALDLPYQELLEQLPDQSRLNVDETGHKDQGERWWTWCFCAKLYTLFKIDATRSGDVLLDVLGEEFDGVLGCDYFSAYRRYMRECNVVVQFCLAHLIRDVKFLTTLPDARDRAYGERLRESLRQLFGVIHRREQLPERTFQQQLQAARDAVWQQAIEQVPPTKHSRNMAKRFEKHGEAYFQFVTLPRVEPTNNLAERAIRFVVIDRHITHGTRGETGRRWCERIWTVIATCSQQGRSVFDYLYAAVQAYFHQTTAPSLLSEAC
jgi:transposase